MRFSAILTELVLFLLCKALRLPFSTNLSPWNMPYKAVSKIEKAGSRGINFGKVRPAFIEREITT